MNAELRLPGHGWIVKVQLHCHAGCRTSEVHFAVAVESCDHAVALLRESLGPVQAEFVPICRLSSRALMRLKLKPARSVRLPDDHRRHSGRGGVHPGPEKTNRGPGLGRRRIVN